MKKLLTVLLIALAAIAAISAQVPTDSIGKKIWKGAVNLNCNFEPAKSNVEGTGQALIQYLSDDDLSAGSCAVNVIISGLENYAAAGFVRSAKETGFISLPVNVTGLENYTVAGFVGSLKEAGIVSFPSQIGALSQFSALLNWHFDESESQGFTDDFDDLIRIISVGNPDEKLGVCRHYAFLTSKIAIEAFGLKSSVVSCYNHMMTQVRSTENNNLILINGANAISELNGRFLSSKDDVDAVMVIAEGQFEAEDVNIDPERNRVAYFNRYNNFAGFWNGLANWNNTDRQNDFFFDRQDLSLFSHINFKGALYGTIERKHWGLEGYYVLNNNQYNRFLEGMQGLNLAGNLPFSSKNNRWKENIFVNLGGYRSTLLVRPETGKDEIRQNSYGLQIALEDYLEYNFTPRLSGGAIVVLNMNREIAREGGSPLDEIDGGGFVSPFVSYSLPGKHLKLVAGTHLTNTLSLPNLWKLTYIPWAQALWQKKDFSSSLRCEYQPASIRLDHIATWSKNFGQLEVRTFAEKYTADFKETNLYHDALGTEIGLIRNIKGIGIAISVTGLTDNCGNKNVFLNLGINL